jgi:hypothetical protein
MAADETAYLNDASVVHGLRNLSAHTSKNLPQANKNYTIAAATLCQSSQ